MSETIFIILVVVLLLAVLLGVALAAVSGGEGESIDKGLTAMLVGVTVLTALVVLAPIFGAW